MKHTFVEMRVGGLFFRGCGGSRSLRHRYATVRCGLLCVGVGRSDRGLLHRYVDVAPRSCSSLRKIK